MGRGQEHRLSRGALTREGLGDRNDSICMYSYMDFLVGFYAKYAPEIGPIPDELPVE